MKIFFFSARQILKVLATLRTKLRDQCFKDISAYPEDLIDTLRWFDYNWAEFEYRYVIIKTIESMLCNSGVFDAHNPTVTIQPDAGVCNV